MIVFLDTDILIDVALARTPFFQPAANLLDLIQAGKMEGFVAWHTLSNFYYLVRPVSGSTTTKEFIRDLLKFVEVSPTSTKEAHQALKLPLKDFEDALQCAAAMAVKADVIATRNFRDFKNSPIPAKNPFLLLKEIH